MKTFYSKDNETFEYDDIGDLIDSLLEEQESAIGLKYYSKQGTEVDLTEYLTSRWILPSADEYLYDGIYDVNGRWDIFQSVTREAKVELNNILKNWCLKHLSIKSLYTLPLKSKQHTITKENIWDII